MKNILNNLNNKLKEIKSLNIINKEKYIFLGVLSIILVTTLLFGSTYSLFTASNVDEDVHVYKTGNLDITYTVSEDDIYFDSSSPVSLEDKENVVPYTITVTNVGNVSYKFNLMLLNTTTTNAIDYQYLMFQVGKFEASSLADCTNNNILKEGIVVEADSEVHIDVRLWVSDNITNDQIGNSFYAKFSIDGFAVHEGESNENEKLTLPGTTDFEYVGKEQRYTVTHSGYYKIEAWGAQGGHYSSTNYAGKGAYTSGEIYLETGTTIYIQVGGAGGNNNSATNVGGYNGGGYSGNNSSAYSSGGGGATDIRLVGGAWNNFESIKSRIMVAAGGGGTANVTSGAYTTYGGNGGALIGEDGGGTYNSATPTGGTQTSAGVGYAATKNGLFAYALQSNVDGYGGGGGGGYYGGAMGNGKGGGGGSSFVSGHNGCNAISESSTSSSITHLGKSEHYSGYVFKNSSMIPGSASMPAHDSNSHIKGNEGHGHARISYIRDRSVMETNYAYIGNYQTYEVMKDGYYEISAWGAQGGHYSSTNYGGKGAYTTGEVYLEKGTMLYAQVGGVGPAIVATTNVGGYNGGGYSGSYADNYSSGGGGATDIRLVGGTWNDSNSLQSRIMVAAGGGGAHYSTAHNSYGGYGGTLIGGTGSGTATYEENTGPSQTGPGYSFNATHLGIFGSAPQANSTGWGGGGGGGYYGGSNGYGKGGAGGSSYISGYQGAVSAGYPQKFRFEYRKNSIKIYDKSDNSLLNYTPTTTIRNISRGINYIGRSHVFANEYLSGQIYSLKITLLDGTVVLHYDFTKNTVNDLSGNGYHGTLEGGAKLGFDGSGYSLMLDGVDDYLEIPTLPGTINLAGGFDIEVEVIFHKLAENSKIIDLGSGENRDIIAFGLYNTNNQFLIEIADGEGDADAPVSNTNVIHLNGINYRSDNNVCATGDADISCSYHYSKKIFRNAKMIDGDSSQPNYDNSSTQTGNTGNGYLKIKYIGE